jgi:hypothetical protein
MPPRRSARVAAVAERASTSALSSLPPALVLHVFSLLPADARARAACVCRGWRNTLEERSLWTRLDLSPSSGVAVRVTGAVLARAAGKARGQLAALDVLGCEVVTFDELLAVVRANGGTLRELRAGAGGVLGLQTLGADRVEQLLQAAPQLTACHAEVLGDSSVTDVRRMLRNEPPFQALRLHALRINFRGDTDEASALAFVADLAALAPSLKRMELGNAPLHTLAALDAVVDVALACAFESVRFVACRLSPAVVPALVRLLGSGTLTELHILQHGQQPLDGSASTLLGATLRANSTLTSLSLNAGAWRDTNAAAALLGALTGHCSLRALTVTLNNNVLEGGHAAGAALGALIAANAPALTELGVSWSNLGDAGLHPLLEALPANTHLRTLNVGGNGMSEAFVRYVLLPAVRANTSLRTLHAGDYVAHSGTVEAIALVAARRRRRGGAF